MNMMHWLLRRELLLLVTACICIALGWLIGSRSMVVRQSKTPQGVGLSEVEWAAVRRVWEKQGDIYFGNEVSQPGRPWRQLPSFPKDRDDRPIAVAFGWRDLSGLPGSTRVVWRPSNSAGDEVVSAITQLHTLRVVDLSGTNVSGHGVKKLATLPVLEELYLDHTAVADDCVEALSTCPSLRYLDVSYSRITAKAVDRLRANLPLCEVRGAERP